MSDRVLVMNGGRILAEIDRKDASQARDSRRRHDAGARREEVGGMSVVGAAPPRRPPRLFGEAS